MDDSQAVQILKRGRELGGPIDGLVNRKLAAPAEHPAQVFALDKFQDQVGLGATVAGVQVARRDGRSGG
jgi:hypothetical protein